MTLSAVAMLAAGLIAVHPEGNPGARLLTVEEKAYDILLETIPWGFRQVRLPWLKKYVQVKWHEKQEF